MTKTEVLAKVMDAAARRVLSGTERPYVVAIEACAELVFLDRDAESVASWGAYLLWAEISDVLDAPGGPESEELCNEIAADLSRRWLARPNRTVESEQEAFLKAFDAEFRERIAAYRATHSNRST